MGTPLFYPAKQGCFVGTPVYLAHKTVGAYEIPFTHLTRCKSNLFTKNAYHRIGEFLIKMQVGLLSDFLALLVCNAARCLASGLAGGLAFAAAAVLSALVEVASSQSDNSFHMHTP